MTEQDFRDKFSSILSKAIKLEMDHPQNWGVATVVSIVLGATVSILSAVGCVVDISVLLITAMNLGVISRIKMMISKIASD